MKKLSLLVVLGAAICALAPGAFADAQTIDFSCIWLYIYQRFQPELPTCAWYDLSTVDWTRQGGLGIPDIEELKLLSLILANPAVPNHDDIHTAFTTNAGLARTTISPTIIGLTISSATTGPTARQPIPGTDPQEYYGFDGLAGANLVFGEWDFYVETMQVLADSPFGSGMTVPTSSEGYFLRDDLRMCGDVDGDGVSNCYEYWASTPYSWAGAIDPEVAEAGYAWNVWACLDDPSANARFWYKADTGRVYFMPTGEITWAEALNYTITYRGRVALPVTLCTIRNALENNYIYYTLARENRIWIGCTDAGRDAGHAAPNPQDWYWLSDPENPMVYANWTLGQPDGVDGAADCGTLSCGTWDDVSEFTGTPPEATRHPAVFELSGTYPDENSDGVPDAFEDNDGDLVPDGFEAYPPEADFSGAPTSGDMPLEVHFTDLSVGNSGTITGWAWNFGDRATSTEQNPTHTYMAYEPSRTYTVSLAVTTTYGTDTQTKTGYITVAYACPLADQLPLQGMLLNNAVMGPESVADELKTSLTLLSISAWADWNIEGIENYPPAVPGDGLNDAVQMALIAYVTCHANLEASASVSAGMATNKSLFEADMAALSEINSGLAALGMFSDLFAGMIGSSPEMKTTINELILTLTGGDSGLPSLDDYVVFGGGAKTGPLFAGYGDLDGDSITNEAEWDAVVAAGGGVDAFLIAATDPDNFWPGNPLLPAAGVVGVGLLAGVLIASAGYVLRKKA